MLLFVGWPRNKDKQHSCWHLRLKQETAPASSVLPLKVINLLKMPPQCNFVLWICLLERKQLFQQLCWIWDWEPQKSNTWNLFLMKLLLTFASVKSSSALLPNQINKLPFCCLSKGLRKKKSFSCESLSVDYVVLTRNKQLLALFHGGFGLVGGLNWMRFG